MRRLQVKAYHKYKWAALKGNPEAQRRIAQSRGYKFSIYDMPGSWFNLMARANIYFEGVEYADDINQADTDTLKL
jgi:hypothetical protein